MLVGGAVALVKDEYESEYTSMLDFRKGVRSYSVYILLDILKRSKLYQNDDSDVFTTCVAVTSWQKTERLKLAAKTESSCHQSQSVPLALLHLNLTSFRCDLMLGILSRVLRTVCKNK